MAKRDLIHQLIYSHCYVNLCQQEQEEGSECLIKHVLIYHYHSQFSFLHVLFVGFYVEEEAYNAYFYSFN